MKALKLIYRIFERSYISTETRHLSNLNKNDGRYLNFVNITFFATSLENRNFQVIYLSGKSIDDRIKKLQRFRQEFERLDFSKFKPGTNVNIFIHSKFMMEADMRVFLQ